MLYVFRYLFTAINQDLFEVCQCLRTLGRPELILLGEALGFSYPTLEKMPNLPDEIVAAWINCNQSDDIVVKYEPSVGRCPGENRAEWPC